MCWQTLEYSDAGKLLKSAVDNALVKKFGPEVDAPNEYWVYDEQGRPSQSADQHGANCRIRANWTLAVAPPGGATYGYVTPLMGPLYTKTGCDSLVEVRANLLGPNGQQYVMRLEVVEQDLALARSSKDAYQAYLANAGERQQQQELDKAKQQKGRHSSLSCTAVFVGQANSAPVAWLHACGDGSGP